ncbi:unnamed protein product [Moneuplotes crassus]|uniref:Uncharacterized protein n=1 Tax=Euplotes crassus TaxID=5936 RepID=A0AAD1UD81_EUPCR|nr:unnamed protein product [Moneuplotes crassus]
MLSRSSIVHNKVSQIMKKNLPRFGTNITANPQNGIISKNIHTIYRNSSSNMYLRSNLSLVQYSFRNMSAQKVVFSKNPIPESGKKDNKDNKDFQKKLQVKENPPQSYKPRNMGSSRQAYYADRKKLYETLKEKWIHNVTKRFDEDLFEDNIQKAHSKHSRKADLTWLTKAERYAEKSFDPYSALLSDVIKTQATSSQKVDLSNIEAKLNSHIKKTILRYLANKDRCLKEATLNSPENTQLASDFDIGIYLLVDPILALKNKQSKDHIVNLTKEVLFPEHSQILDIKELEISQEMATKIVFLNMIKKYNFFQGIDILFRELAKVLIELKEEGISEPAQNYENLLNSTFFVSQDKDKTFEANLESIPVDEGLIKQPEFIYAAKVQKVHLIKKYRKMLSEFERVKHYHSLLRSAIDDPTLFSKLMSSHTELESLLASINEETEHITDDGTFDRILKVGGIYDEVVRNYVQTTFDIHDVGIHNMYEIYNPLKNGKFHDLLTVRDQLVKDGLSLEEADRLAQEYIIRAYEDSKGPYKFYNLIESHLEESQEAISEFHSTKTLRDLKFNVTSLEEFEFSLQDRRRKAGHLRSYLMAGGDLNEYNKVSNSVFQNKLANEPVRLKRNAFSNFSTRNFCTKQEPEQKKAGGFTQYLKKLIKIDSEKEKEDQKKLEDIAKNDPTNIKIEFQKIKSSILMDKTESEAAEPLDFAKQEVAQTPEQRLIEEATKRFPLEFFKEFSLADEKLMQTHLEEYIRDMENLDDIPLFVISFLANALELNNWIENTHILFYKIFCTPKINKEERKESEKENLLSGNLFKTSISSYGYRSLLHSVLLKGKKKHFKKIIKHIETYMSPDEVTDSLIADIIKVASQLDCPILLGRTIKRFIDKGVDISKQNFLDFCLYLDMCKGFERDTMQFLNLANDNGNIQIEWDTMEKFFLRALNHKSGAEIIKIYKKITDDLKPNKHNLQLSEKDQEQLLFDIKLRICTELIHLGTTKKAFTLVETLHNDYIYMTMENKDPNDLLGLKISTAKGDIKQFEEILNNIFMGDFSETKITQNSMETIARYITKFNSEDDSLIVTEFIKKYILKTSAENLIISPNTYKLFIGILIKNQNWDLLQELIEKTDVETIRNDFSTLKRLKESLIYCLDQKQRSEIKTKLESIDKI